MPDGEEMIKTEPAFTRAELEMARRIDGRFEQARQNGQFAALIAMYATMTITGIWLRTLLIPRGWEVAAACAFVAIMAWALPWLSWVSGRKPPAWVISAESCQQALKDLIPAATMAVISETIDRVRQRSRRRWHGASVYLSRCARSGPPDTGMCRTAGVLPLNGRLIVVIGEHMTEAPPQITAAVLAHESRHVAPVRMYMTYLIMLSRLLGWVVIGWAVPWPFLLLAVLIYHVAATLLSWVIEASCDLGAAAEVGPSATLAALNYVRQNDAQVNKDRSRVARFNRAVLIWVAAPVHPPLALRSAIIRRRWPQASARDGHKELA